MLKAIHAAEDVQAAREKAEAVVAKLREQRLTKAAELIEACVHETLAYYSFPEEHWRRIRANVATDARYERVPVGGSVMHSTIQNRLIIGSI